MKTKEDIIKRINEIEEKQFNLMMKNWNRNGNQARLYSELTREQKELREQLKNF